jgi:hypothetical protein
MSIVVQNVLCLQWLESRPKRLTSRMGGKLTLARERKEPFNSFSRKEFEPKSNRLRTHLETRLM